jgi:transposase InsO family protein
MDGLPRVLTAHLGARRLRLTDTERRCLAALAHPLGRKRLKDVANLVTPDTLRRWYLLHDRDTKYTQAFEDFLKGRGVEPVVLPPRSPNLSAHCERFVRSIKEEALEHMV